MGSPGHPNDIETRIRDLVVRRAPVGLALLRTDGTLVWANEMVGQLAGENTTEIIGRNLIEFVADDVDRIVRMVEFARASDASIRGPIRVRYRSGATGTVETHAWSTDTMGLDGDDDNYFVVALTPDWSGSYVNTALTGVLHGASAEDTMARLTRSTSGHPFCSPSIWLVNDGGEQRLVGGEHVTEGVRALLSSGGPWWAALARPELTCTTLDDGDRSRSLRSAGVSTWWLRPLQRVTSADAGLLILRATDDPISPNQLEHLEEIVTVASLAIGREALESELLYSAHHDSLTGAGNRDRFFDHEHRDVSSTSLLYLDLDDFKPVNDRFGHAAGDLMLVTIAERIKQIIRPGDQLTRIGGDEFVIECHGPRDETHVAKIAQRIIDSVRQPVDIDGTSVTVGASIGIALAGDADSLHRLLELADDALYTAKRSGRGRWSMSERSTSERASKFGSASRD